MKKWWMIEGIKEWMNKGKKEWEEYANQRKDKEMNDDPDLVTGTFWVTDPE
jgi:hypothetical protein